MLCIEMDRESLSPSGSETSDSDKPYAIFLAYFHLEIIFATTVYGEIGVAP